MRIILFVCVFLFVLSCLFSIEDRFLDMKQIFSVKKQTVIVYVVSCGIAALIAVLYDYILYNCWIK